MSERNDTLNLEKSNEKSNGENDDLMRRGCCKGHVTVPMREMRTLQDDEIENG